MSNLSTTQLYSGIYLFFADFNTYIFKIHMSHVSSLSHVSTATTPGKQKINKIESLT